MAKGSSFGLATYTYRDCDDSSVPPIVYHGKYDVVSGGFDGHLTDPTLRIDAIRRRDSHVRWRYAIRSLDIGDGATAIRLEMFEDFGLVRDPGCTGRRTSGSTRSQLTRPSSRMV